MTFNRACVALTIGVICINGGALLPADGDLNIVQVLGAVFLSFSAGSFFTLGYYRIDR